MSTEQSDAVQRDWQRREALAEAALPLCGALYREQGLVTAVMGSSLVKKSPIEILRILDEAGHAAKQTLHIEDAVTLMGHMREMPLGRARIDIGRLMLQFYGSDSTDLVSWASETLQPLVAATKPALDRPQDVVLYGFGRIGRLLARILINKTGGGDKYRLRAVVLRKSGTPDLSRRASLLRRDSVHGIFSGTIDIDYENSAIIANGNVIHMIYADAPDQVDYTTYGIQDAVVIDNTGKWRDREGLGLHLSCPGVSRALLTAPGIDIPNIVFGVNHDSLSPDETIVSAASCTTNAIVPVLKAVNDRWGIVNGHVETVHAFTNDQNLLDNFHKKDRRGRSAPLNMVITSTGAASAAAKALPELAGKLTGSAIRVPTPNVSLAILNLNLEREIDRDSLNTHLIRIAAGSPLQSQIGLSRSKEMVSSDLVGDHHAGTIDSVATIAHDKRCVIYVWYDNEYGYSCQVVRLLQHVAGVSPVNFPKPEWPAHT